MGSRKISMGRGKILMGIPVKFLRVSKKGRGKIFTGRLSTELTHKIFMGEG